MLPGELARLRHAADRGADDPPRAVVPGGEPALAEAVDLDVGPGVRRVDEVPVADVDPDVVEPVEEDEVSGLELVLRHRDAARVVPLRHGVVRQRDPDLRVHVLDEAGAVEAGGRARAAPDVRDAEVLHRDRDDAAVGRCRAAAAREQVVREKRRGVGGEGGAVRLVAEPAEPARGGVEPLLQLGHARLGGAAADAEQDGVLLGVELVGEEAGVVGDAEKPPLGARELPGLRAGAAELRVRRRDSAAGGIELGLELLGREDNSDSAGSAAPAVQAGEPQHLVHVPGGVVVAIDGAGDVELSAAAGEVARRAEDRVRGVVRVGDAVPVRVDSPPRPRRGHELHPADRAGGARPEVAAEVGLDLVDRASTSHGMP